jgi:SAM-dependent methyltransferase
MGMEAQQLLQGDRGQLRDDAAAREPPGMRGARGVSALERALIERFGTSLHGRVLVLGCSVGRFTALLYRIAYELHGVCEATEQVARCRRAYPQAVFTTCDPRDLLDFAPCVFDAVLVPGDTFDVLDHRDRRDVLQDARALLKGDGLLVFASHNCAFTSAPGAWVRVLLGSPRRPLQSALRLPRRVRNRRRLSALERRGDEYELRNDGAREFGVLHHYVSRDSQERQLSELGYELLECLDCDGRSVERSASAQRSRVLHYVARAY